MLDQGSAAQAGSYSQVQSRQDRASPSILLGDQDHHPSVA
jgi:hypothetical protein